MSDMIASPQDIAFKVDLEKIEREHQEEINAIKINCVRHNAKNEAMANDIKEIKENVKGLYAKFDALNDKLDTKYASKWVEKAVGGLIIIMALSALYFIMHAVGLK